MHVVDFRDLVAKWDPRPEVAGLFQPKGATPPVWSNLRNDPGFRMSQKCSLHTDVMTRVSVAQHVGGQDECCGRDVSPSEVVRGDFGLRVTRAIGMPVVVRSPHAADVSIMRCGPFMMKAESTDGGSHE